MRDEEKRQRNEDEVERRKRSLKERESEGWNMHRA